MEELLKTINDTTDALKKNLAEFEEYKFKYGNYNKAGARRIRVLSLDLEKLMKQFRTKTVKL